MKTIALRGLWLVVVLLSTGCYAWRRGDVPPVEAKAKRPESFSDVRLYVHGQVLELHKVRLTHDSVSGVRAARAHTCGSSCRTALARAEIDSALVHKLSAFGITVATLAGLTAFYLFSVCDEGGTPACPL